MVESEAKFLLFTVHLAGEDAVNLCFLLPLQRPLGERFCGPKMNRDFGGHLESPYLVNNETAIFDFIYNPPAILTNMTLRRHQQASIFQF